MPVSPGASVFALNSDFSPWTTTPIEQHNECVDGSGRPNKPLLCARKSLVEEEAMS